MNKLELILACWLLTACATTGSDARPTGGDPPPAEMVFTPSGEPARQYAAGSATAGRTTFSDAVLAAASVAGPVPTWNDRLAAVVSDLAAIVPPDETVGYSLIEFALHHYGIAEPTPHLLILFSNRCDQAALAAAVGERLAPLLDERSYQRIGIGVATRGDRRAVVVGLQSSHLELDPVPRRVPAGGRVQLRGRLQKPFGEPGVLVTRESGAVETVEVRERRGQFRADVPCQSGTVMRIEVSGVSSEGSSVLANFPVYCGREPPVDFRTAFAGAVDLSDIAAVEQRLADRVNEARRRAGLPALAVDAEVSAVARAYSEEMARSGQVVHVSPTSGAADDRLRAAGVLRPLVQENLARAATLEEAHRSLMNSPGHRANILSDLATHVGIGVAAVAAHDLLVTQLFTRIPPPVDCDEARSVMTERATEALSVRVDEALHRIAQVHAQRMAANGGGRPEDIRDSADLQKLSQFRGVRVVVMAVADVSQFLADKLPKRAGASHVGIGVGQGHHDRLGEGAIYVVMLLGVVR